MVFQRGTKIPGNDGGGEGGGVKQDIQAKKKLSIGFDFFFVSF